MIFRHIGAFAARYRYPIIIAWLAAAAIITLVSPNIDDVSSSDSSDFLPADAPHIHAEQVYKDAFPNDFAPSQSVIIIDAEQAGGILDRDATTFEDQIDTEPGRLISALGSWLLSDNAPDSIERVDLPTSSPETASMMVAPDNQVAMVRVELNTDGLSDETEETMETIDKWLDDHRPSTIRTYQTGGSAINQDTTDSAVTSVDRTIYITIILVIVMLLIVYRSPVSPFVPLTSVTVAYLITRGIVAYLGDTVMTITFIANVLLVVVMYGAGTDYCLFLISRFREEMADEPGVKPAVRTTVHRVGETISSSAGTIFVGFMAMSFAEMGIFRTTGPALALGIFFSLAAGLTLVPALLAILGDRAFWPSQAKHRAAGRFYDMTSRLVSTRPLLTVVVIVLIMLPSSIYATQHGVSYDGLADLPDDRPSVIGFELMENSLGAGNIAPLTVVATERDLNTVAAEIVELSQTLYALDGVADVRSLNRPLGQNNDTYGDLLRVDGQLNLMITMLATMETDTPDLEQGIALVNGIQTYLDTLATTFPTIADDPNLLVLQDLFGTPGSLLTRQDEIRPALEGLAARFDPAKTEPIENPYVLPTSLAELASAFSQSGFDQLLNTYLTADGTTYKVEVILADAYSDSRALDTVDEIRDILTGYEGKGEAIATGASVVTADIRDTMDRDYLQAVGFVLLGIFIVLLLMLRSVVAPIYLIGTVTLSFTFTLGLTHLVFTTLLDVEGLTWYVPFFSFVFLVALGIDYSIFLFGRIKEEVGNHGIREGVHVAVASTGAIITSAGIILSGTFAAMMAGEIAGLVEIGFAVSVGVLVDTFVVRTILDPALATLFDRWTWWPGGVPGEDRRQRIGRAAPATGD